MGPIAVFQSHQQEYSPDGQGFPPLRGSTELCIHSVSDGHEVQLTRLGADINSYTWSPDSHRIAFGDNRYGKFDVFTVAVPGGAVTRITSDRLFADLVHLDAGQPAGRLCPAR